MRTATVLLQSRRSVVLLADCSEPVEASQKPRGWPFKVEIGPAPGASKAQEARANMHDDALSPRNRGIL